MEIPIWKCGPELAPQVILNGYTPRFENPNPRLFTSSLQEPQPFAFTLCPVPSIAPGTRCILTKFSVE